MIDLDQWNSSKKMYLLMSGQLQIIKDYSTELRNEGIEVSDFQQATYKFQVKPLRFGCTSGNFK